MTPEQQQTPTHEAASASSPVRVSVVIPVFRPDASFDDLIASLDAQTLPQDRFEVLLCDDGSGPETQERLTQRIADHLRHSLAAKGVGVVVEAEHTCMTLRGARVPGSKTVTSALFGRLRDDPATRAEFLGLTRTGR